MQQMPHRRHRSGTNPRARFMRLFVRGRKPLPKGLGAALLASLGASIMQIRASGGASDSPGALEGHVVAVKRRRGGEKQQRVSCIGKKEREFSTPSWSKGEREGERERVYRGGSRECVGNWTTLSVMRGFFPLYQYTPY